LGNVGRQGAGEGLASSLNIAAFNLGNALGAWTGVALDGLGLGAVTWTAALFPAAAVLVALAAARSMKRLKPVVQGSDHQRG
jgi:DHA1 family inner membrane transport protein